MKFGYVVEICLWPHLAVKGLIFRPCFCDFGANEVASRSFINTGGPKMTHSSLIRSLFKALVHSNFSAASAVMNN